MLISLSAYRIWSLGRPAGEHLMMIMPYWPQIASYETPTINNKKTAKSFLWSANGAVEAVLDY